MGIISILPTGYFALIEKEEQGIGYSTGHRMRLFLCTAEIVEEQS